MSHLILSGKPGVGKTTLIKEVAWPHRGRLAGFFTEEVREGRERTAFELKTFSGRAFTLASKAMHSKHKVGKYGVDVSKFDVLAVPELENPPEGAACLVIDEIGSMEALSDKFRAAVLARLSGGTPVLATIREGTHAFSDPIKKMAGCEVIELTRANFLDVKARVQSWLAQKL